MIHLILEHEMFNWFRQVQQQNVLPLFRHTRRGGLLVSALDSGASGPGSSLGRGHCVVSWAIHFTLTVPLSTQMYKWIAVNCWGKT